SGESASGMPTEALDRGGRPKALRASRAKRAVALVASILAVRSACTRSMSAEQGAACAVSIACASTTAAQAGPRPIFGRSLARRRAPPGTHIIVRLLRYIAATNACREWPSQLRDATASRAARGVVSVVVAMPAAPHGTRQLGRNS